MTALPFPPRLGVFGQTGYASGNFGKSLLWSTTEYFLLFYLTDLLGMPPAAAGLLILLSLVLDAALGPVVGFAADRTRTSLGKYSPYLAIGAPLVAVSFALLFTMGSGTGRSIVTVATALFAFRAAYVICDVPHNALMARIVSDSREASTVSGLRFLFSSAGAFVAATAAGAALAAAIVQDAVAALSWAAALAGGVYVVTMWVALVSTRRIDRALPNRAAGIPLGKAIRLLLSNRSLGALLILAMIQVALLPLFAKGLSYWGIHHHGDAGWSGRALGLVAASQCVSMVAWIPFGRRRPPIVLARMAFGLVGIAALVFAGGLALEMDAAETTALVVYGFGNAGAIAALWALLPGAIAAGGIPGGPEVESLPTGVFLFVIKVGAGLGTAVLGMVLEHIGLDGNPEPAIRDRLGILLTATLSAAAILCFLTTFLLDRPPSRETRMA